MVRTKQEDAADAEAAKPKPAHQGSGRPNDLPIGGVAPDNSTFAERAKRRGANKRVTPDGAAQK